MKTELFFENRQTKLSSRSGQWSVREEGLDYYPFGLQMPSRTTNSESYRYGVNSQEKETEITNTASHYSAEYWMYDSRLGRRWNIDPKSNPSMGGYTTFANNPIFLSDPFGDTTFVSINKDGKYDVKGGTLNDNHNGIYLKKDGKVGKLIGYSATPESFYNSEAGKWMGTIDTNDQSGRNFLNNEILAKDPNMLKYMKNATGGEFYDFKRTNGTDNVLFTKDEDYYRGMPLSLKGDNSSMPVYGSARDVGNVGAGIIAGRNGLSWSIARFGFDFLETKQKEGTFIMLYPFNRVNESSSTQYGERLGFRIGSQLRQAETIEQLKRLPSYGGLPQIKVSNSILIRSDYTPTK